MQTPMPQLQKLLLTELVSHKSATLALWVN